MTFLAKPPFPQSLVKWNGTYWEPVRIGAPNGIASLDNTGKLDPSQLPSVAVDLFVLPIIQGDATNNTSTFKRIGATQFDSSIIDNQSFTFKFSAILQTTNQANPARVRLYNFTTNTVIGLVSSSGLSSDFQSLNITLPTGNNIYEVHLAMTNAPAPNTQEYATCSNAHIEIITA